MYSAEILLDSINKERTRLTTMRVTFPRFILSEFNTHRVFSRNAASSRAISVKRRMQMIKDNPVFPLEWGQNQPGMSADHELDLETQLDANTAWMDAIHSALDIADYLNILGAHKQIVNRILEPFSWATVIVSSTEWENFFTLRCSPLAQPEIKKIAELMREVYNASTPQLVGWGGWHIPLASTKEVAVGRLARVSYETGAKTDAEEIALCEQLKLNKHWSPFEHVAQATHHGSSRNFRPGWVQWRAMID